MTNIVTISIPAVYPPGCCNLMDQCGEASAATKLSALTLQDRSLLTAKKQRNFQGNGNEKAEYFEFADENNWANEFKNAKQQQQQIQQQQPFAFEEAFNRARAMPSTSDLWIKDFQNQTRPVGTNEDFEKFNKIFDSIAVKDQKNWQEEFARHEIKNLNASDWIEDFKNEPPTQSSEIDETAASARILLESLDLSDPKLASSKFVAYLKELTENDPTINGTFSGGHETYNWEQEFQKSMEAAGLAGDAEDDQWINLEKAWDKYEFSGQGYEQFAPKEFAQYRYSIDDALNPFHGLGSETIRSELAGLKTRDLAKYILALEELTRLRPDDAGIWKDLGMAQADNELDVQAIAAFYRAVQCDPKLNSAWMGLGAACVNEYCIPDALDAFNTIAKNYLNDSFTIDQSNQLNNLIAIFRNSSLIPDEFVRVGVLSVLLNISGEHDEAISLLQNSSINLNDYTVWNRLGATLANSHRYDEALNAYERALNINPSYVRGLYNMSVSYMNQSNYPKSIAYMVRALQYHLPVSTQVDPANLSEALRTGYDTIWNTMRIVGDMWGREDINVLIEERNISAIMDILKEVL